jgi:flavin-dependent dehydrogenase
MVDPDVVIIGGGPGGSVCAAKLAEHGRRVLVLERETFPRFHLGESLLPQSMAVLESLGIMPKLRERFIPKYGARFHFDEANKKERYVFANAFDSRFDHAFEVPRDEFDDLLLRNAERRGAEVRHQWTVKRIRFEGTRAVGVDAVDPAGVSHSIAARMVVDATGRDALLAGDRRNKTRIDRLDKSAFYTHYRGTKRQTGEQEGDIDIVIFPSGWFWFIPFKDGRTSVGAVVSSAWVKENHASDATKILARAIAQSPAASDLLEGAEVLWPARAAADYSYRVTETYGDGWLMVGDAGGFIDPLFSSGVHIAMRGAVGAAELIHDGLSQNDLGKERFTTWAAEVKLGTDTFVDAVQAFYSGGLVRYLFAEKKHTFLRRSITSLLAGDVYSTDARWIKDVRTRLAEMASPTWNPAPIVGVG